jgi:transmembrane sensor
MEIERDARRNAHLWRARIDDGLTAEEQHQFESWLMQDPRNAEYFAEARLVWKALADVHYDTELYGNKAGWIESILGRFSSAGTQVAAASVAVVAAAAILLFTGLPRSVAPDVKARTHHFATAKETTRLITLADGTVLTLGPMSKIKMTWTETSRRAELSAGSAFFEVAHNAARPFTVATVFGDVRVTGTSFDLQLYDDVLAIAVSQGSVRVSQLPGMQTAKLSATINLSAGQEMRATHAGFSAIRRVDPTELGAWRSGRLVYVHAPLSQVIADTNRYSERSITVDPDVGRLRLSGTFDARDIDTLLINIDEALPVQLVETNSTVRIIGARR